MKGIVAILAVVTIVITAWIMIAKGIELHNNIDAWKARAQVAATPSEMKGYLGELNKVLDWYRMDRGYTSKFFQNPWTDMREVRKNINRVIVRAEALESLSPQSDAYNQGMDDLRGTLRELRFDPFGYWIWNEGGSVSVIALLASIIVLLTIGISAGVLDQ